MIVRYLDHMGSDLEVVNDARVSFGKESEWDYPMDGAEMVDDPIFGRIETTRYRRDLKPADARDDLRAESR